MLQSIRRNFGLKLLAVALAILGWAYFRFAGNPALAARFDQQLSVPITAINLPVGYVAHVIDKDVVVTIQSQPGQPAVKPDELKAVIDLSKIDLPSGSVGVYNVAVDLVRPNVAVQSYSPASVTLSVERIVEKVYTIQPHYTGTNQNVVVGSSAIVPISVSVRGPATTVDQIARVGVDVPFPGSPTGFDAMIRPTPVDAQGVELGNLQVTPALARVRVTFVAGTGAKR